MWDGRPSKEESIALRREVRIDVDVITGDHHIVVRIDHCRHGVEPSRRRDNCRVTVVRRGSVCTVRSQTVETKAIGLRDVYLLTPGQGMPGA